MELKVFQKENVSFTEMLEFLIKYLVLFDTSSLYSGKPVVAKLEYGDLYDTCFNSSSPVQVLSGGSQKVISPAKPKAQAKLTQGAISIDKDTDLPEIIEERTRFNDKGFNFKSELLDLLNEGARIIKNGVAYVMSFIAFASIYPAIPFFAVLAALYGILNWLFAKIKML